LKENLIMIFTLMALFGCRSYPDLKVVDYVDLQKYSGKWYEIASFPQRFQEGCYCSTAEYIIGKERFIRVINRCRKWSVDGDLKEVSGRAYVVPNSNNAKLDVQFFWPFRGDYWIIELADDYSWAVVGHPNRKYLWILSRTPKMVDSIYEEIIRRVKAKGFEPANLRLTVQTCED